MSEMEEKKEKGKGKEKEEEVILDHCHRHPLNLTEFDREYELCYGCTRYIVSGETVYMCRHKCRWSPILHEECAEMPREIRLSIHPQHTLIQREDMYTYPTCAVCEGKIERIGYYCSSPDSCGFNIHVGCAPNKGMLKRHDHPSHPHQLTLLWRPGRSCLSRCDACGTIERGNSYSCIDCQYAIHESCADLPATADYRHLHHHPLSLAFYVPQEYLKFKFPCYICFKEFLPKHWVYHCGICRYVAHIKCAIKASPTNMNNIGTNAAGDKDVITFPINNIVEDLIGPFVVKVGGAMSIPHDNGKYKFHNHDHELSLISCPFHDEKEQKEEEEYSDDDDDLNLRPKSELICDGCTTSIYQRRHHSSNKGYNYYLSCGECKYFLHWKCFHLPHELPSHPLHPIDDHNLLLKNLPKLDTTYCDICLAYTNGLIYKCTKCGFKVDMKCASLPDTIKHAAHPHHHLKLLSREITRTYSYIIRLCGACGVGTYKKACYKCGICEFIVHYSCASLPAAVRNPAWDRHHPLPLTFDATLNRPGDFYCDVCEQQMNPRTWMYHCRSCDISFHPDCFPTASGDFRNIKFGQRYMVPAVHPHPVAYQLLTKKLRCDVCGERMSYGCFGFQCAEDKCYFFMCLEPCARNYLDESLFGDVRLLLATSLTSAV